jgi:hypothetical protein
LTKATLHEPQDWNASEESDAVEGDSGGLKGKGERRQANLTERGHGEDPSITNNETLVEAGDNGENVSHKVNPSLVSTALRRRGARKGLHDLADQGQDGLASRCLPR